MSVSRVCLGFTSYRLETIPFVRARMRQYQCIVLEEPHTPGFNEMLGGEMAIDSYLLLTDFGFPKFAREQCRTLQELHSQDKTIYQVEPFLHELIGIHEYFAAGGTPQEIKEGTIARKVYDCERIWTSRLLDFYKASSSAPDFLEVVNSVKNFARADAQKGRLRDVMRAGELKDLFKTCPSLYVEAGYIHFALLRELSENVPSSAKFEIFYSLEEYFRSKIGRRQLLGPGDVLTLLYTCRPDYEGLKADLLAARSLIYNKVVHKDEFQEEPGNLPHARDEIQAVYLANSLDYNQCASLYEIIRGLGTEDAGKQVQSWLKSVRQ